jgi:DNA-binding MarR family transcriptional regulator
MQFVVEEGVAIRDLHTRARTTRDSLTGLQRWGYVTVTPAPGDHRPKPSEADRVVRPTRYGRRAQEIWGPLAGTIEERWRERFGREEIESLRGSLLALIDRLEVDLPCYLPVVHPTQNGRAELPRPRAPVDSAEGTALPDLDLSVLLSRALLAFTLDYESEARISLPISATTLRVLDGDGVRLRDLPILTGVSQEANAMSVGFLVRCECAVIEPIPSVSRGKRVRLTQKGERAQSKYLRVLDETEARWVTRYGPDLCASLRGSLERILTQDPTATGSPLARGLEPYPDGWRASVRKPALLPQYPMVLHRGGWPDGS